MSDESEGYVHDPAEFDADGERRKREEHPEGSPHPEAVEREFGWRGWVLVGVIVVAFVVSPLAILLWPPELNYVVALLILPLVPALVLALTAVWATTRP